MRILVVESERDVLEDICRTIVARADHILETAETGREAVERAELFHPEVLIIDRKIPGISAIIVLAEIRHIQPLIIPIILTTESELESTRKLMGVQIFDCITKPINSECVYGTVTRACNYLREIRINRMEELNMQERYAKMKPLMERAFLQVLQNCTDPGMFHEYRDILGLDFEAGFFIVLSFRELGETAWKIEWENSVAREMRQLWHGLVGVENDHALPVFIPLLRSTPDFSHETDRRSEICNQILQYFRNKHFMAELIMGVGSLRSSLAEYWLSYWEAVRSLDYAAPGIPTYYDTAFDLFMADWESGVHHQFHEIAQAIRFGRVDRVEMLCREVATQYRFIPPETAGCFRYCLLELVVGAFQTCRDMAAGRIPRPTFTQILSLVDLQSDLNIVLARVTSVLLQLAEAIRECREARQKTVVSQAKQLVERRYQEDLSLEALARAVSISPFYLSRLFREEVGMGFSQYLTRLRLEKGMGMLARGASVKECATAVGYHDPNYFSRIFRKYYRQSPTEFRQTLLNPKE